jgi:hypothetical protein
MKSVVGSVLVDVSSANQKLMVEMEGLLSISAITRGGAADFTLFLSQHNWRQCWMQDLYFKGSSDICGLYQLVLSKSAHNEKKRNGILKHMEGLIETSETGIQI